jgi:hypothetical protein
MEDPKTRRETKQDPKSKKQSGYTTKHIRIVQALKEKRSQ